MGWEWLKVFHFNLPTDVRPGLETQQAMTVERVREQFTARSMLGLQFKTQRSILCKIKHFH